MRKPTVFHARGKILRHYMSLSYHLHSDGSCTMGLNSDEHTTKTEAQMKALIEGINRRWDEEKAARNK